MKAFNFELPDQDGKLHKLSDYKNKWVVLYFYPRDNTPGCTKQACTFRDLANQYKRENAVILGISKDSVSSHEKFAEKYNLNFTLLSDESKNVIKKYKSWGKKKFAGREFEGTVRNTYLIDPKGNIVKSYLKVNPTENPEEILADIKK